MEDSAIFVDSNKTSFTEKKNLTVVYVHGFRGGKNTFVDFPNLLKEYLEPYNIEINNKIFDAFETKGEFEIIVNKIIKWIYAETYKEPIVLMGHSMGGILVADVFRKIMKGEIEEHNDSTYRPNIIGIFGFDSPYFGLSISAYGTGLKRIGDTVSTATRFVSSLFTNNENNDPIQARTTENNINGEKKSKWGTFGSLALGAATIGYMLYKNENTREMIQSGNGNQIISESTKYIIEYKRFLEPLLNLDDQNIRIDEIIKYIQDSSINGKEQFIFKNYYPITEIQTENGMTKQNFVLLPSNPQYLKFFDVINGAKDSTDVIYSHTNMFKSKTNEENLKKLTKKCTDDLYHLLKNIQQ